MIFFLALIIFLLWLGFKYYKKNKSIQDEEDPFLRKITATSLGPGKSVHVITLLDKAYVVGVTDSSVNVIGEIADKEQVEAMNVYADSHANITKPKNFNEILDMFVEGASRVTKKSGSKASKKSSNTSENLDGSAEQLVSSLRKTRARLHKEEQ